MGIDTIFLSLNQMEGCLLNFNMTNHWKKLNVTEKGSDKKYVGIYNLKITHFGLMTASFLVKTDDDEGSASTARSAILAGLMEDNVRCIASTGYSTGQLNCHFLRVDCFSAIGRWRQHSTGPVENVSRKKSKTARNRCTCSTMVVVVVPSPQCLLLSFRFSLSLSLTSFWRDGNFMNELTLALSFHNYPDHVCAC